MIHTGKCPSCKNVLRSVRIENLDITIGIQPAWKGVSYVCPACNAILGVQIDPVALKTDTIKGIMHSLRTGWHE